MSVKYNIELADDISADFWKCLNENFDVVLIRKQHSIDGDTLHIELKIIKEPSKN